VLVYSVSVFLHIVGALGLFAGIALEQASLLGLRRARTVAQAREWAGLLRARQRLEGPAALLVLATGVYMVATRWGHHAWIGLGLLGMVLMAALGAGLTARRAGAIARAIEGEIAGAVPLGGGPLPPALRRQLHDPLLRASASLRTALALGIVFDMTVKPGTGGALAALGVALALGAVAAVARWGGGRDGVPVGAPAPEA
jgi:hypothetical protein